MPRLSALAIRAALLYLLAGFTLGALLLANKGVPFGSWVWDLLPAHIEFLLFGWTVQLIMGMAYWILPRFPSGARSASVGSRGNTHLAAAALIALNAGVLLVAFQAAWIGLLITGRALEIAAGVLFALHAWGRIRPTTG